MIRPSIFNAKPKNDPILWQGHLLRRTAIQLYLIWGTCLNCPAQLLPGFKATEKYYEQELTIKDSLKNYTIHINAPLEINRRHKTYLALFALPNGNSIAWTKGKKLNTGDDWHFDIQHIDAQTRFVRNLDKKHNYILVYLMADQKSWPSWKHNTQDSLLVIKTLVESIQQRFSRYHPSMIVSSHSGGGSFVFGLIDAFGDIPDNIKSISFIDSEYGYNDSLHKNKLVRWLIKNSEHKLLALAYNDSLVVFNGKPLVSAKGGTWYRTRLLQRNLSETFAFNTEADTALIRHQALQGRIQVILKENPMGQIYHTEQVARNGFILSLLFATRYDQKKYFTYFGQRVYEQYITE